MPRSPDSAIRSVQLTYYLIITAFFLSCHHSCCVSASTVGSGEAATSKKSSSALQLSPKEDLARAISQLNYQEGDQKLLLVGIFCRTKDVAKRQLLRATNHQLAPRGVDIFFIIGNSPTADETGAELALAAEFELYKDIYRLPVDENMNKGKSYAFFSSIGGKLSNYAYYMKADLDSYILYHHLAASVDNLPRNKAYYGILSKFEDEEYPFMSGMGHVLSADLVRMISECGEPCDDIKDGYEDKITGTMVGMLAGDETSYVDAHRGKVAYFYQLEKSRYGHDVHSDTILVHNVKSSRTWLQLHIALMQVLGPENLQAAILRDVTASPGTTIPGVKEGSIKEFSFKGPPTMYG